MTLLGNFRRRPPKSTAGARLYAIGDVHGCFEQLVELIRLIEDDNAGRTPCDTHLILLGDYIDRGPQSADVCRLLFSMRQSSRFHCLRGNHEQALVDIIRGDRSPLGFWLDYGGVETAASWGINPMLAEEARQSEGAADRLIEQLAGAIPADMLEWMAASPSHVCLGDYMFVHAGIRPRRAIDRQDDHDLLWIKEPFLSSRARHPYMVVHGHSVITAPEVLPNRIGIDTGAYHTGVLTAVGIEDEECWFLQTGRPAWL